MLAEAMTAPARPYSQLTMDSLTQAVLGASLQGALLGRTQGPRSLLYGAALATVPDLDVIIRHADPLSRMTSHRGFSHSVLVLTAFAALLAWAVRRRWPEAPYSTQRLFMTLWLVLVTHPLLDAFTVYGTQLFWPLPVTPQSWAAVFIVDPVYTVPLVIGVGWALVGGLSRTSVRAMTAALAFSTAYLFFGLGARWLAEHRVGEALAAGGVRVTELRGVPMPLNTLVWRVIAKTDRGDYHEAVSSVFDRGPPETLELPLHLGLARVLGDLPLHRRFEWFTDHWLRYDRIGDALVVSDLRMGIAGQYTFRFKMAVCRDAAWHPVTPTDWHGEPAGMPELQLILRRIVQQQPALPLARWNERFLEAPARGDPVPCGGDAPAR